MITIAPLPGESLGEHRASRASADDHEVNLVGSS